MVFPPKDYWIKVNIDKMAAYSYSAAGREPHDELYLGKLTEKEVHEIVRIINDAHKRKEEKWT